MRRVAGISAANSNTEEELLARARSGDQSAYTELITRLTPMVFSRAADFSKNTGLLIEDLAQEGMLALLKAAAAFSFEEGAAFSTFAYTVISNRMRDLLRRRRALREMPIDEAVIADTAESAEDLFQSIEETHAMMQRLRSELTALELQVAEGYLSGESYAETAARLGTSSKAVDNAMQRIRKKMRPPAE
ncbi:MAG: sigma-70 family RNA polymerase sigma factor [Oscillospiraceae bacterium]|jgi:RNA polymerase sporulation-specific sigma factor|nr:sigma-70 family RNA polymerase sigma factor [Oscillospiraceae bacterium]